MSTSALNKASLDDSVFSVEGCSAGGAASSFVLGSSAVTELDVDLK